MKIPSMKFTNLKCSRKSFVRWFENYIFCLPYPRLLLQNVSCSFTKY